MQHPRANKTFTHNGERESNLIQAGYKLLERVVVLSVV